MANEIPSTSFRYVQVEETNPKWSFSESVVQGVGGNNNYLNAEANRIQGLIDTYLSTGGLLITPLLLTGFPNADMLTPNGQPWVAAFLTLISASIRSAEPHVVIPGPTTWYNAGGFGIIPAIMSGNLLRVSGYALGTPNYWGFGLYKTAP